ncbi:hypothetical protein L218DRAFT_958176 [Marasmius fiardii PR-910]|nr:hypothetical protein L218DRAFT_958176 [Marasmius fiardii PR-910]
MMSECSILRDRDLTQTLPRFSCLDRDKSYLLSGISILNMTAWLPWVMMAVPPEILR